MLMGCIANQSPKAITNNTFRTFEIVYVEGLSVANDLYQQDLISDEKRTEILKEAGIFKEAYVAAAISFDTYNRFPTSLNEEALDRLLMNALELQGSFKRLIRRL